ncbi:Inositol 2-dehydrogenase/D-chiro-inositol 3-dehydrogenase [Gimesia panareensis]|uniref:Inositol 2-dehydrogenase/D-chiro-inositol 3-dehydrogenase n=1 Tax=Gimesia panareensis TaxID=2527978 RepID=A0A518FXZ7_9PLAN|nr:Gfo/Idh/MocA family oxidoreductase [Gimesia panareensis]QDV21130.1 Inositol 2-dehydrogenase/D-chiro-inositol 3-dehydrogenase [Gimesia panareensis]
MNLLRGHIRFYFCLLLCCCLTTVLQAEDAKTVKIGIIGLDTSHSSNFTKILNSAEPKFPEFAACRVVAAYPQGSRDIKESLESVPQITEQVTAQGVKIVPSIAALLEQVDAVLLESNDGRVHLEQALPVLKAGKPLFVDKPVAGDLADVIAIYEAAKKYQTPVFSSSSLRYTDGAKKINSGAVGEIVGCDAFSPCPTESTHPDFYWYGIHGVETLYTIMGPGCATVVRVHTPNTDLAVGTWEDGRIGTFRGRRKESNGYQGGYGGTVYGSKGIASIGSFSGYEPLLVEVVKFFQTGKAPVSPEETMEIYTFMTAAEQSKSSGGKPVALQDVYQQARQAALKKLAGLKD